MRLRYGVAVFAAAAFVAGCGSEGGDGGSGANGAEAQDTVVQAASRTTEAGTYRSSFALHLDFLGEAAIDITGDGAFQTDPLLGSMTLDMSEAGRAARQDLGTAELLFDGTILYMRFPALVQALPDVGPWIKFDLERFASDRGLELGQLSQLSQSDPSQTLQYLRGAGDDVDEVGEEDVRGEPTTHYGTAIDLDRVAETVPEQRRAIEQLIQMSGMREVPTDVWIDDDGRVRRLRLAYEDVRFGSRQEADMTVTIELYDFGAEVDVSPPPPDQVTDISEFQGRTD